MKITKPYQIVSLSRHYSPQAVDDGNVELVAQADWLIQLRFEMIHELQDFLSYQLLHVWFAKTKIPEDKVGNIWLLS